MSVKEMGGPATANAYALFVSGGYCEVFGLDFEQFRPGQVFRHRPGITISNQDNTDESLDTLNGAQVHYDALYAANTEFARPLVVSTLTLQKALGASWKTFARKDRIVDFEEIAALAPVFGGATLYAESTILDVQDEDDADPCGLVKVRLRVFVDRKAEVATATYRVRVFKAGQHPEYGGASFRPAAFANRFAAYKQQSDGAWMEQTGLFFDDFAVGEVFHHRPTACVSPAEAVEHARRSLDWNPRFHNTVHCFAFFGDRIPPLTEAHALGAVTATTTRTFGRVVANLAWRNIKLHRLIQPGTPLRTQSLVREVKTSKSRPDQGILTVTTSAFDRDARAVLSYDRTLLVYRRGHGPYAASGY